MFSVRFLALGSMHNLALAALALSPSASALAEPAQGPGYEASGDTISFTVDVAENFDLFETTLLRLTSGQSEAEPLFFTEGRVFPAGTIEGDGGDFEPNTGGSIGRWLCRGARTTSVRLLTQEDDSQVHIAQLYLFPDEMRAIATEGIDGDVTDVRRVSHATGMYQGYTGEQRQEFLGYNATGGVNLRVTFILKKK